jgi:lysophospholipase L1-like esterase
MNNDEKSFVINDLIGRYHPENMYPWMPGAANPEVKAALFGISVDEYNDGVKRFALQAREAAQELLKDTDTLDLIKQLPFRKTDTIVAYGDGQAADRAGWFGMLKYAVELTMEGAAQKWVFSGREGDTTADLLRRVERDVLIHKPDWVILSTGTFDAQMIPFQANRTLVSLADTYENVSALSDLLADRVKNPVIWITPVPVLSEFVENRELFELDFDNDAIESIRELVAGKPGYIIDPSGTRFGNPAEAWNYASDGVNPSVAGHMIVVKTILRILVNAKEVKGKRLGDGVQL